MELTFQTATPAERLYTARQAVQPVPAVAVDEQVFLPLVGLQPYQVGILRRVRPEAERKAVVKAAPIQLGDAFQVREDEWWSFFEQVKGV